MTRPRTGGRVVGLAALLGVLTAGTGAATAYALWSTTAPTNVSVQAATVGTPGSFTCVSLVLAARLSWTPPTSGPAPTSYVVERAGTANGTFSAVQWLPGSALRTDIGAALGGGHYRVRASLAPAPTNPPLQPPAEPAWVSAPTTSRQVSTLNLVCT